MEIFFHAWQFFVPRRGNGQSHTLVLFQPREKLRGATQKLPRVCEVINEQYCIYTCNSYTMGTCALPDIYTLSLGPAALRQVRKCVYTRQCTRVNSVTNK